MVKRTEVLAVEKTPLTRQERQDMRLDVGLRHDGLRVDRRGHQHPRDRHPERDGEAREHARPGVMPALDEPIRRRRDPRRCRCLRPRPAVRVAESLDGAPPRS